MFGYGTRQCPARTYAVDILTSALIGLLILPELQLADRESKAITYDGALMSAHARALHLAGGKKQPCLRSSGSR